MAMNVSLTPELERFVGEKVESGYYTSASEVVREALRLLKDHDNMRQQQLANLKSGLDLGFEQLSRGEGRTGNEVFAALEERSRRRRQQR